MSLTYLKLLNQNKKGTLSPGLATYAKFTIVRYFFRTWKPDKL